MNEYLESSIKFLKKLPLIGDFLEKKPKVAVLRFAGVIADTAGRKQGISHSKFSKSIERTFEKEGLKAVALIINSPGGSPAQTSLISSHIRRLADEKNIAVYAFIEDVAASGGYWLACSADEIYAQEVSIIGSIGVISAGFGLEDFIEEHGIHRRMHTSGKSKSFLDPFMAESKEDLERLETIQKDIHFAFKEWVRNRRDGKIDESDKDLFEGAFWTAGPAMDKGLIDGFGDVQSIMQEKCGEQVRLIDTTPERKLALLGRFGILGAGHSTIADDILEALEKKGLLSRYGL